MTDKSDKLSIEYRRLSDLVPLKSNSKKHATENTIALILEFGFKDPIGIDPSLNGGKGGITEGHDRRAALLEIKKRDIPAPRGIILDKDGEWMVPVLIGIHLESEPKAIKYSVLHNHSTIRGAGLDPIDELKLFDRDLLLEQAEYLDTHGEDLGAIGDLNTILETLNAGDGESDEEIPDDNRNIDEESLGETKHECPNCKFRW
jgi:hypothetical protein